MKKYTNLLTFTQETYKCLTKYFKNIYKFTYGCSRNIQMFNKIQEKLHKFPYIYQRNIQMFNKIHEKEYKKLKYFIV